MPFTDHAYTFVAIVGPYASHAAHNATMKRPVEAKTCPIPFTFPRKSV